MERVIRKLSKQQKLLMVMSSVVFFVGLGIYFYINNTHAATAVSDKERKNLVTTAEAFVGVKEDPKGSNKGAFIDKWNTGVSCNKGDAWCASFVSAMLKDTFGSSDASTCSTKEMMNKFKNNHSVYAFSFSKLKVGDVVYRTRPTGGHVAIVASINSDGKTFKTIEGNTKCAGSDNDCVRYHTYDKNGKTKDSDNASANKWSKILRW